MKFRSWMETHIVRPKKKNKKEKSAKKSSELSVSLPDRSSLDSAGNSPTSPQLPKRQPIILPEVLDHTFDSPEVTSPARYFLHANHAQFLSDRTNRNNCFYSPFRGGNRGVCACACFNTGLSPLTCTCYPMFDEQCNLVEEFRKLHSIRTTYLPLDQLQDSRNSNISSPRQRSKIRTNPWLTPKSAKEYGKSFRTSSSSSECGSTSEDNFQERSGSQSSKRHSYMSVTTDGSDTGGDTTPSDLSLTTPTSSSKDNSCCGDYILSIDNRDKAASRDIIKQNKTKTGSASDSDSDECETLNELGQFEENYEYERETDILDDDTDDEAIYNRHRLFYEGSEAGFHTPTYAQNSSDSDTASEKIEYADMDEESSDSSTPPLETGMNLAINIIGDEVTTDDNIAVGTDTLALTNSGTPNASTSQITSPISDANSIDAHASPKLLSVSSHSLSSHEDKNISLQLGSRTLGEIRESLEEKVRRLRLERLFVEEKIREAREEERIRREEKIKFQKQLILHRRQILLRTLRNLREKLEDQSARLQDAYSATLEMQLQVRRQLGTNSFHPLLVVTPVQDGSGRTREAPF